MKLQVGIYQSNQEQSVLNNTGWKIVCEQEKLPHKFVDQPDCQIILFDGYTPPWFLSFIENGGLGIVTDCHPSNLPFKIYTGADVSIDTIDLSELGGGERTRVQCIARLYTGKGWGKIRVHENRVEKNGITQDEYPVFLFKNVGKGGCFYSGLPFSRLILALGDKLRKSSNFSDFSERIVAIDKHHLIKSMRGILIKAFHYLKLPYVYLDYYPNEYKSAVTFRIDVDGAFGENILRLSKSAVARGFKLTFFISMSLCEGDEKYIKNIDPIHEIGNHANIHNLFTDYESNYKNILECKNWLEEMGFKNNPWFAGPRGLWNHSLHKALEDLGYLYTSDFGAGIAGFPLYPYINGIRSHTMQIPVNPFSVERASIWEMENNGTDITQEFVADFFEKVIEENYSINYPSMLYSHPKKMGEIADFVFERINQKIAGRNIWKTTLTEFANWWNRRDKADFIIDYDLQSKKIKVLGNLDKDMNIKVINP